MCFLLCSLPVFLLAVAPGINGAYSCKSSTNDPCKCTYNGTTIDISGFFDYPVSVTPDHDGYKYQYSCTDSPCEKDKKKTGVACQFDGSNTFSLGVVNSNMKWFINSVSESDFNFTIAYTGGEDGRVTTITFKHTDSPMAIKVDSSQNKKYIITATGKKVKKQSGKSSSSSQKKNISGPIGISIMCIIDLQSFLPVCQLALAGIVTYFIVGGVYLYRVKGARGMEVVPNIAFWKDFPFLIKDGFMFTISPCYKRSGKYENL